MKLTKKLVGISLGITSAIIAIPAFAFAAIPDTSGQIHSCYNNGLLPTFRIINSSSQNCGFGETSLNWAQNGGAYVKLGDSDTVATDSSGIVTDGHTTALNAACNTGDYATNGILSATGSGVSNFLAVSPSREGDPVSMSSFSDSSSVGINVGDNTGAPNINVSLKFYVVCLPVPTLPS